MSNGAVFAGDTAPAITSATIIGVGPDQTRNLPKVITPFESKTKSGQFVLQSPNGSIDSVGLADELVQLGGNLTEHPAHLLCVEMPELHGYACASSVPQASPRVLRW